MKALLTISRVIDGITTLFGRLSWWVTLLMIVIGILNVITRYVGRSFGLSLGGTGYIALQTYAFDFVFLMAAAYVFRVDGHVRVDIIFSNLRERTKAVIDILGTLFLLLPFCILGLQFSYPYVMRSWRQGEVNVSAGGLPVYPAKALILAAFVLLIVQGVSQIIKNAAFLAGHTDSGSPHSRVTDQTEAI